MYQSRAVFSQCAGASIGMLRKTTVSTVRPGPNPNSTPQSRPSPVVALPSFTDCFLIWSSMNKTQALDMLPYSLSTCLVARIFSFCNWSLSSTWSKIAGPPGCAIQKIEFQSLIPAYTTHILALYTYEYLLWHCLLYVLMTNIIIKIIYFLLTDRSKGLDETFLDVCRDKPWHVLE